MDTKVLLDKIGSQRQEIKSDRMDMSFGEIINMYKDGEIEISPEYQRAFRWDRQRQTDFIESILLGIPFPSIFVATNDDGKWELIDGLQRVSTVLSFFGELRDPLKNRLKLVSGSIIKELNDMDIDTLPLELRLTIKRTPCRVEIIQKESNFQMRYELFKRLNTGGEGLTRQEIRNCIFRGFPQYEFFNQKIIDASKSNDFHEIVVISDERAEEKLYEELALRFFALSNYRTDYTENTIQDFFDAVMKKQSENPDMEIIENTFTKFNRILSFIIKGKKARDIFKLARLYFSTSMFDAIMLSLANTTKDIDTLDIDTFIDKCNDLKENVAFKKYAGAGSSNPSNINNKLEIAREVLLNENE